MKFKQYWIITVAALILICEILAFSGIVNTFFLPAPHSIILELIKLSANKEILLDILFTLMRFIISIIFAITIGVPIGLFLGSHYRIYKSFEIIIDFFRSVPISAMFPLFLLLFGIGDSSKIATAIFSASLIIIFNTSSALMNTKKTRTLATKLMGATKYQLFKYISFWEILPQIIISIRTATSISLIVIIITEMFIGTAIGIGKRIMDFQYIYNIKGVYAMILVAGLIGFLINLLFVKLEKNLIHWAGK